MSSTTGPLSEWTQHRMTACYQASDREQFRKAFDNLVSKHADVTCNGRKMARDQYEQQMWESQALKRSAAVQYMGTVAIPKDAREPLNGGEVGMFARMTVYQKDLPAQRLINSSYNFVLGEDKDAIQWPTGAGVGPEVQPGTLTRALVVNTVTNEGSGIYHEH